MFDSYIVADTSKRQFIISFQSKLLQMNIKRLWQFLKSDSNFKILKIDEQRAKAFVTKPKAKLKFRCELLSPAVFCQIHIRIYVDYKGINRKCSLPFPPVMTNCWINVLVSIMCHDRWNYHNPEYSPISIIIPKFNRTNPVSGNRGRGAARERERERERENLRAWERWLNISFIRNRCWMAGFYRFHLPSRKMAAIFTFYNSPLFVQHGETGATTVHDISHIYFPLILCFVSFRVSCFIVISFYNSRKIVCSNGNVRHLFTAAAALRTLLNRLRTTRSITRARIVLFFFSCSIHSVWNGRNIMGASYFIAIGRNFWKKKWSM